jgi:hypothetical protein
MIDRAKAAGLQVDETTPGLLPDLGAVNLLGPTHDPRQGWSVKDRLTPTIRSVCEKDVDVELFEKLYRPRDRGGKPLATINEMVHPSVIARYGRDALISPEDKVTTRKRQSYAPKNLRPLFAAPGQPKGTTPVWP